MFDIRDPAQIEAAIRFADETTIRRHRAMRMPLIVEQDGQIVELDPFDVPLPEDSRALSPSAPRASRGT